MIKNHKLNLRFVLSLIVFIGSCIINTDSFAQTYPPTFDTIIVAHDSVIFAMPATPTIISNGHGIRHSVIVDSLLTVQVDILDSAYIDTSAIFSTALDSSEHDTLIAMAKLMLISTNSELTYSQYDIVSGYTGFEIGMTYSGLATNVPYMSFVKYLLIDHVFVCLTVTAAQSDLTRALLYRDEFFSSLTIL